MLLLGYQWREIASTSNKPCRVQGNVAVALLQVTMYLADKAYHMSSWTHPIWQWLQSLAGQQKEYASLPCEDTDPASRRNTAADATPQQIHTAISLSHWLPAALQSADAATDLTALDGLTACEAEQIDRSACESFLQGYSLF